MSRCRSTVVAALLLSLVTTVACVSSSTHGDFQAVNTLVDQRAQLRVIERSPEQFEAPDDDAARVLAQPLTIESAVRVALLNNRDLRADLRDLGVARGELVQASLLPNPDFEAQLRTPQSSPSGPARWDLGIGFDLTRAILVPLRKGVAQADLEAARYRVAGSVLDLSYRVRLAFRTLQARQQQVELAQTTLSAFTASYDAARALHEIGNLPTLDLETEQVAYEQARVAVTEAEAARDDARERLNVLLGVFGAATHWQLAERLPDAPEQPSDPDDLEAQAIKNSLELAEARSQLTAQARAVGLTQTAGWLPDLNVGVHADRDNGVWAVGPSVTGTLPVFDRLQGQRLSLESEFWAMRERYVATAVGLRAAMRAARNRLLSAQTRAQHYRTVILPLRERLVAETRLHYNAMQIGVFQLLQARKDQVESAAAYIETLREYWQARAAFDQLLAGRVTGTLDSVMSEHSHTPSSSSAGQKMHLTRRDAP